MRLRCVSLVLSGVLAATAADWPQWRGANRDGVIPGFVEPKAWPEKLTKKWAAKVGEGHSSPVVAEGRIYVHLRQGEDEVAQALDPATGKVVWRDSYRAPYEMLQVAARHGKGVKSTPIVADGRLFTLGISGILSAFDAKTGKLLWRKDTSAQYGKKLPLYGVAMSPLVDRGLVIAHVGGHDRGALTAFDVSTGQERWKWAGDGPAYSSPVLIEADGIRQIVTQTQERAISVSAAEGKLLWEMPLRTAYQQNSVTPLVYGGNVILSGLSFGTLMVKPRKASFEKLWHVHDVSLYMNTPVASAGTVYGMSHRNRGQFFALDTSSGKVLWTTHGREADNTAIVAAGSYLWLLKDSAELVVVKANANSYEPVRTYTVADSPTWAHPVPLGANGILIKDVETLTLWTY